MEEKQRSWRCIFVCVTNPDNPNEKGERVKVRVDPRVVYTSLYRTLLEERNIKPTGKMGFPTTGGRLIQREVGPVLIKYRGEYAIVPVVFAEPEEEPTIGVTALADMGFTLDPISKKIVAIPIPVLKK